jgi:subfamily B ATP-binding cassette protein MsbA
LFFIAPVRNGVIESIRNDLYHKTLILPLSYYSNHKKGDLLTRITSDVQEIEHSVMGTLMFFVSEPITIILYVITLIILSPKLMLFSLILIPISGYVIGIISRTLKQTAKKGQSNLGNIISLVEESIDGLRIIKAFNAINFADREFRKSNRVYTKLMTKIYRIRDIASPLTEVLGVGVTVLAILYGGRLVLTENSLSASVLIVFIIILSQLLPPIKSLTQAYYDIKRGAASMDRIEEIFNADEVIEEKEDAQPIKEFKYAIEFKDVSFKYEETFVLNNINLKIEKGKKIAIVGPSGTGKTTLMNLIPRFYDCTTGEVLIDNINIKDLKIDDLRGLSGIVTQDSILFNNTVLYNISFGMEDYSLEDVIRVAKIANAHNFIMDLPNGYNTIIGDRGTKLSGGQKQRLSIARALLKNPPILLLDEATSALDTESEKIVHEALEKLMQSRTSLVIAHRLSTIMNADEIIVMDEGRIVERGTHQQLYQNKDGLYHRLCNMQAL